MSTKMYPVVQVYSGSDSVMSKSDIKRQAILENAYRLFRAQGFDRTSMADITSEVGGSKATLYSHFPQRKNYSSNA
jgi:AcrR family transcriptional regulator